MCHVDQSYARNPCCKRSMRKASLVCPGCQFSSPKNPPEFSTKNHLNQTSMKSPLLGGTAVNLPVFLARLIFFPATNAQWEIQIAGMTSFISPWMCGTRRMLVLFLDFSRQFFDVKNIMESNWMKTELTPVISTLEPKGHPTWNPANHLNQASITLDL